MRAGVVIAWTATSLMGAAAAPAQQQCECQCFDNRPLLVCQHPEQPPSPPNCGPEVCPPPKSPASAPAPDLKVCSNELVFNEATKQFDSRRICKDALGRAVTP